jgi:DmsE family decaheme c-type cytochrome
MIATTWHRLCPNSKLTVSGPVESTDNAHTIPILNTLLLGAVLLFAQLFALSAMAQAPTPAAYVGEKVCARCHDAEDKQFGHTLHAKVFRLNPKNETEKQVCEACHGPASNHVKNPTDREALIGFTREWGTPIEKQNDVCLSCHQGGQRLHWPGSTHATNKLGCADCHNPMAKFSANGLLKKLSVTETCETCHAQQRAEFRKRSHMPVPEGKMSCADCHNPHGSITRPLLKADSVNEVCYTCHAERRGPLLWEHAPVRENCLNCHYPHGSNQDKLLQVARPFLCQQCHGNPTHPSNLYNAGQSLGGGAAANSSVLGRSCQNCHSQIHGSNHPGGARFQR